MTNPDYFWSETLTRTLSEAYERGGLREAERAIPDKKRNTLATKASRMKLTNPRPRKHPTDCYED